MATLVHQPPDQSLPSVKKKIKKNGIVYNYECNHMTMNQKKTKAVVVFICNFFFQNHYYLKSISAVTILWSCPYPGLSVGGCIFPKLGVFRSSLRAFPRKIFDKGGGVVVVLTLKIRGVHSHRGVRTGLNENDADFTYHTAQSMCPLSRWHINFYWKWLWIEASKVKLVTLTHEKGLISLLFWGP